MQFTAMSGQQRKNDEPSGTSRVGYHTRPMRVLSQQHLALPLATAHKVNPPVSAAVVRIEKKWQARL
jgi:hypothetical protein